MQYPPQLTRRRARRVDKKTGEFDIIWSFGGQVLWKEYNNVDIDLRELICECTNHNPFHRPTVPDLERIFEKKLTLMERERQGTEELAQRCRDFFGSALGSG